MEGIVGHIASWAIHALVIGVVLLFVLAYALGWIKTNKQIPTEAVTFVNDGGGGGNPSGSGDDRGGKAPLKEGVQANNNNAGNTTNPNTQNDRPDLTAVTKPNDPTFAPPHYVNADPEALKSIRGLDEVLSGKDFNPSKGVGGTGTGTGEGPGTGPGVGPGTGPGAGGAPTPKTVSEAQRQRWKSISITTGPRGGDFLSKLQMSDTILAVPVAPFNPNDLDHARFTIIDLSKPGSQTEGGKADLEALHRGIWWYIAEPNDIQDLAGPLGLKERPPVIIAFMSPELQDALANKEKAKTHMTEAEMEKRVEATGFMVVVEGKCRWDVEVTDIKHYK